MSDRNYLMSPDKKVNSQNVMDIILDGFEMDEDDEQVKYQNKIELNQFTIFSLFLFVLKSNMPKIFREIFQ